MARALIGNRQHEFVSGEGLIVTFDVTFFGQGVPGGADSTVCRATVTGGMSKAQARQTVRDAISAEAAALGYPYSGVAMVLDELFVGL